ncbi:high mobility group protein hmgi-c isoform x2 [Limosa lapponica baueri]|uniref:High mobility group protein hmgi-c isoform x2 n=1 Tax=Limosa lapponica baueri TaxID=1758121 RepID=A0A2I0UR65_LIMLA|nr:high mobility group protein hmgi-c isoform x2 [Limosa lapponica baueri]
MDWNSGRNSYHISFGKKSGTKPRAVSGFSASTSHLRKSSFLGSGCLVAYLCQGSLDINDTRTRFWISLDRNQLVNHLLKDQEEDPKEAKTRVPLKQPRRKQKPLVKSDPGAGPENGIEWRDLGPEGFEPNISLKDI